MGHVFSPTLKKSTAEIGAVMLNRGDTVAAFPFGQTKDSLYVSSDPNAVLWTETAEVGFAHTRFGRAFWGNLGEHLAFRLGAGW